MRERRGTMLIVFLVICEGVGALSGWLSAPEIADWYRLLAKPSFNPPNWIFAPVWTAMYAVMALAAWLVWRTPDTRARTAGLQLFWLQLVLNFLWSMLFFRGHALLGAGLEIVLLLATIVAAANLFRSSSRAAAWLMTPYACWVGFATVLTWAVWRLNG